LEPFLVRPSDPFSVFMIGLIEEGAKIAGVMWIARRKRPILDVDGLIIGVAAGMGFAALESMGYTFTEFLTSQGSLSATVGTMLLRGVLSPFGHGTWTGILASVLFQEATKDKYRITRRVIRAYLFVVLLHALWDGLPPVVEFIFSSNLSVLIAQAAIGIAGFAVLWKRWQRAQRLQTEPFYQDNR
ncbi:MAG: PrsW family intramembrane metalloprotease, partial [Rectinema subterraneum]|uniref:PrsW family intramembrane metalloprotease n=1 Tax=Rectinema subterraneum TaxID=2653714 RepID=UPI003C7C8763